MEQFLPIIIIAILSFLLNGKKKAPKQRQKPAENRPLQPAMEQPRRRAGQGTRQAGGGRVDTAPQKQNERMERAPSPSHTAMPKSLRGVADVLLTRVESHPAAEKKKSEAERELERLKKQVKNYEEKIRMLQIKASGPDPARKTEAKTAPARSVFADQNDIVRGVIMAEVLGRPKAMKRKLR